MKGKRGLFLAIGVLIAVAVLAQVMGLEGGTDVGHACVIFGICGSR